MKLSQANDDVLIRSRSAKRRISLALAAGILCALVSAGLSITAFKYHAVSLVPRWLVWIEGVAGVLAAGLSYGVDHVAEKKQLKLGAARRTVMWAAGILGFAGIITWFVLLNPNWHGGP